MFWYWKVAWELTRDPDKERHRERYHKYTGSREAQKGEEIQLGCFMLSYISMWYLEQNYNCFSSLLPLATTFTHPSLWNKIFFSISKSSKNCLLKDPQAEIYKRKCALLGRKGKPSPVVAVTKQQRLPVNVPSPDVTPHKLLRTACNHELCQPAKFEINID